MSRPKSDTFRTNTLTVLGAVGYLVALLLVVAREVLGYPVSWQAIGFVLLTASALLNVDFGSDLLPVAIRARTADDTDTDTENDTDTDTE